MAEERLIDANALCQHIQDWKTRCYELHRHSTGMYHMMIYDVLCQVLDVINDTPTVLIETAPVIDIKNLQPVWRDPKTDPPNVEEEVLILFETVCGGYGITTAHYEDGTVLSEKSAFYWEEIFEWGTYDEESDDYFIPKGWWEYRYFNPDEVYNNQIDRPVVGWMPLPEKLKKEGVA